MNFDPGWPLRDAGAVLSSCGQYRYTLHRRWGRGQANDFVAFIGLNPSVADADVDDNTIRQCVGFAKFWGYSGLVMLNAYAYRATDPADMLKAADPIGEHNDKALLHYLQRSWIQRVVLCWGNNITPERSQQMRKLLSRVDIFYHHLGLTKKGEPRHPLRIARSTPLKLFNLEL